MYRIKQRNLKKSNKINILLKQEQKLFHTGDLALLWGIVNKNTLYTTIARYVKKGILLAIHKGFYSVVPLDELDPLLIGLRYLHRYAYVSTETVLVKQGIILQDIPYITLVSEQSQRFTLNGRLYLCRQMKPEFLYQTIGIERQGAMLVASQERAVADLFYFNRHYHLDGKDLIDWQKVKNLEKTIGYL